MYLDSRFFKPNGGLNKRHSRITSQGFREAIDIRVKPDIFLDDDRLSLESSFQVGGDFVVQAYKAYHRLQVATQAASERLRSRITTYERECYFEDDTIRVEMMLCWKWRPRGSK